MKNTEYIALDRRFTKINSGEIKDEDISNSYLFFDQSASNEFSWEKLLELEDLVVILGEAGSGKTFELRQQSKILKSKGEFSFFIQLESFKNTPYSLDPEDNELFQLWLTSQALGTFFLDSVDESKLTQVIDFQNSIRNLKKLIGLESLIRCKFIISSRISEWRPNIDSNIVRSLITDPKRGICVATIQPLDRKRIIKYSESLNLDNIEDFIDQIDSRFAWDLVRRPLDIHDLAEYWKKHSTLGALKDIIEYDIQEKLKEKNTDRSTNDNITYEKLREGSEYLAVSTILLNELDFLIKDNNSFEISDENNSIDPESVLPSNWSSSELRSLLQRPLFDDAIYGKIRIHHRRKSEYLAASWFIRLFNSNCDYFKNVDLFFGTKKGKTFARVKYRPILAWLAIGNYPWSNDIRAKIISTCPEIFLEFGDPASLSGHYKIEIIEALFDKFGDRDRFYKYYEMEALSRLGDNSLGSLFGKMLRETDISESFKGLILRIAYSSATTTCTEEIFEISVDDNSTHYLKTLSIEYIGKFGSQEQIEKLKKYYLDEEDLTNSIIERLITSLFPDSLSTQEVLQLISKTQPVREYDLVINYSLKMLIESCIERLDSSTIEELLVGFTNLLLNPPYKSYYRPISARFEWLKETHCFLLNYFSENNDPVKHTAILSKALFIHVVLREFANPARENIKEGLALLANRSIEFRKSYGLFALKHLETSNKHYNIVFHNSLFEPKPKTDLQWVLEELPTEQEEDLKEALFVFALTIWQKLGHPFFVRRRIQKLIPDKPDWEEKLYRSFYTRIKSVLLGFYYGNRLYKFKFWMNRLPQKLRKKKGDLLVFPRVILRLGSLNKEKNFRFIRYFYYASLSREETKYEKFDENKIQKRHGKLIARIAKNSIKKYWRIYNPSIPTISEGTHTSGSLVGLMSIDLNLKDGDLNIIELSDNEIQTLILYALNEINGFSYWLETLTTLNPSKVRKALEDQIELELNSSINELKFSVIKNLRYSDNYLLSALDQCLLENFERATTSNLKVLGNAITVLSNVEGANDVIAKKAYYGLNISSIFSAFYLLLIIKLLENEEAFSINWLINYEFVTKNHLFWISTLLQFDAKKGLLELKNILNLNNNKKNLVVQLAGSFSDRSYYYDYPEIEEPSYLSMDHLPEFYKIIYEYVHPTDDINRGSGSYSPNQRDHAQDFRGFLFGKIVESDDPSIDPFLDELLELELFSPSHELITHNIEKRSERFVDNLNWEPKHIPSLMQNCLKDPSSDFELFRFAVNKLEEIKYEVLGSDTSSRHYVRSEDNESRLRSFLKRELESKSNEFYAVPQEVEIDREDIPDIRVEKPSLNPISIEVKKAENWTYNQLVSGLKDQLAGKYLRSSKHTYGIYTIGYIDQDKKSHWENSDGTRMNFEEMINSLKLIAKEIENEEYLIFGIKVIGIDFT